MTFASLFWAHISALVRYPDMQMPLPVSGLLLVLLLSVAAPTTSLAGEPVNAVIGDRSAEGITEPLSEQARLEVHLTYVEEMLRARPTRHLSVTQRKARMAVLDRLRAYRLRAEFPTNQYSPERAPVFVDAEGVRCAVGAIAEPDIGSKEVERISRVSRLAYVGEIESTPLLKWASESGFTLEELATIQPTYSGGGSVEMPRDPTPVRHSRHRLARAWRSCRSEAYPVNVGWGGSRISNTVSFVTTKDEKKLRAELELKVVETGGTKLNPAPSKKQSRSFLACVQEQFGESTYRPTEEVKHGTRYGLSIPNYGGPLIREKDGTLNIGPAHEHVLQRLGMVNKICSVPARSWYKVDVSVTPEGGVQSVQVSPYQRFPDKDAGAVKVDDSVASCISKELPELLRFPRSKKMTKLSVRGH